MPKRLENPTTTGVANLVYRKNPFSSKRILELMQFIVGKKWLKVLWLASLTIISVLVAGELLARYVGAPQPYSALYVYDDNLGYHSPLNSKVTFAAGGNTYTVFFDHEGIADRAGDHNPQIIILGDGVTAGLELAAQDRLAHQLSRLLGGKGVVNLSITGYGTIQQALLLEEWLASHQSRPEHVILVFNLSNDVLDNIREWDGDGVPNISLTRPDSGILSPKLPSIFYRAAAKLYHEWRLAGYLSQLRHQPTVKQIPTQLTGLFDPQLSDEMKAALAGTRLGLEKIEQLSKRNGFKLHGLFWVDDGIYESIPNENIKIAIDRIAALTAEGHWLKSAVPGSDGHVEPEWSKRFLIEGTRHANINGLNKVADSLVQKVRGQ